jgi:tetratricopeptide (TPR) repeat protein
MLLISLSGPLRVTDAEGRDVTPKSAKARGLLAILALSKDMRRSRMWLRGKLWSTSGQAQGSDSLRQCLTEIRKSFGPHAPALIADRRSVALASPLVEIATSSNGTADPAELCSDLELMDPEFQNWLASARTSAMQASLNAPTVLGDGPKTLPAVVVFSMPHAVAPEAQWVFQSLRESIALMLHEGGEIDVVTENEPVETRHGSMRNYFFLVIDVNAVGGQAVVSTRIERGSEGKTLWNSGQVWLQNDGSDQSIWELHKLSYTTHEQTARAVAEAHGERPDTNNAYALAMRGRNRLFEFSRDSLTDADRFFAAAYQIEPRGAFLAWRHFVRNTADFEYLTDDFLEPVNRVDLIEQAVMDSSNNSFVLSVASQDAFVRKGDLDLAQTLVSDAIERNPVNPLGLGFQSNILVLKGEYDKSVQVAERAQSLVKNEPYRGFWSLFQCLPYMAKGDYETAAFHANLSHYLMPRMVASQRYLYALNEAMGRESQALTVFRKIRKREPDFSKQHLFRSDYPVGTMRRTGIMDLLT